MQRNLISLLVILALLVVSCLWACGDDDDDDSTAGGEPDDDDQTDDDDDDDDNDNNDDNDDNNDDATPTGPAPLIDGLSLIPAEGFSGDTITISFHWQDLEGDVQNGEVTLYIDGIQTATFAPATAGDYSGYIDLAYALPDTLDAGDLVLEVELTDEADNTSNRLSADFEYHGTNTAPVISNLYFDPAPACPNASVPFNIVFTYVDNEANLNGGTINIIVDDLFYAPLQAVIQQDMPPTQTIAVSLSTAYLPIAVEDHQIVTFTIQLMDNQGLGSNLLEDNLLFSDDACSK